MKMMSPICVKTLCQHTNFNTSISPHMHENGVKK